MKCQVCERELAPTLSICPKCGAMMNDSIREELEVKVNSGGLRMPPAVQASREATVSVPRPELAPPPKPIVTSPLNAQTTSPTLVGFQPKETPVPEWRLQVQNAVRQRNGGTAAGPASSNMAAAAVAVKQSEQRPAQNILPDNADPRLARALAKINSSRKAYGLAAEIERPSAPLPPRPATPNKPYPYGVVNSAPAPIASTAAAAPVPVVAAPEPRKIPNPVLRPVFSAPEAERVETNKLPRIEKIVEKKIERVEPIEELTEDAPHPAEFEGVRRIVISAEAPLADEAEIYEEIEDLAPMAMRFNAGLFDVVIGLVAAMVVVSPLAFAAENWLSPMILIAFGAAFIAVMFIYLTAATGFYGRTIGMRIFNILAVDLEENEYPTLRQAAINSAVYIASLMFFGFGLFSVFLNEERRGWHDIASNTIVVSEF